MQITNFSISTRPYLPPIYFSSTSRDAELYELPEHIRSVSAKYKKTEAMLSNQMLSGIPEVDLGIE